MISHENDGIVFRDRLGARRAGPLLLHAATSSDGTVSLRLCGIQRLPRRPAASRATTCAPTRCRSRWLASKSDPVSWDTELARMTVTKEAGHGDEAEEAGDTAGAVQSTERGRAPRAVERPAEV